MCMLAVRGRWRAVWEPGTVPPVAHGILYCDYSVSVLLVRWVFCQVSTAAWSMGCCAECRELLLYDVNVEA